jgi:hypothetical protein
MNGTWAARAWLGLALLTMFFAGVAIGQGARPTELQNGNFEAGQPDAVPPGWKVTTTATRGLLSRSEPAQGEKCAVLMREGTPGANDFGNLMQVLDATPYRGKRVRFSAQVKHTGEPGQAQLWFRVDRPNLTQGFFDNMGDRPITSDQWKRYEIVGDVAEDAVTLNFGMILMGGGEAAIDDADLSLAKPVPVANVPPRALSDRGLENLVAFARLYGYVRHFHPTDEALAADWIQLAMVGAERAEGATDAPALAKALNDIFGGIAPTVRISVLAGFGPLPIPPGSTHWVSWRQIGYGQGQTSGQGFSPYSSTVVRESIAHDDSTRDGTKPGTTIDVDLGGGVWASVPIGVYADEKRTLPQASGTVPILQRPDGWEPIGDDRTTRLADVIIAWNILRHFYPYFDVVQTDWPGTLKEALRRAATDPDARAFQITLERMGAALHDGHTGVSGPLTRGFRPPLSWAWVGDELVMTQAPGDSVSPRLARGDVVRSIDGRTIPEIYADLSSRISAATEQWRRYRALDRIAVSDSPGVVDMVVQHADGTTESLRVPLAPRISATEEPKLADGTELAPGIFYFDLNGAASEALEPFYETFANAKGVVFDMRGYPGSAGVELLKHLTDKTMRSANWNVPIILMPDGEDVTYPTANWNVEPAAPRFKSKVVFITDGRAISYAETCMGIVEAYHLGEIVGGPTAGTNGNVISLALPGRYKITYTGMRVTKHDGSRHHGVGILPTVPVSRTIQGIREGRDELLERAVQVASGGK